MGVQARTQISCFNYFYSLICGYPFIAWVYNCDPLILDAADGKAEAEGLIVLSN